MQYRTLPSERRTPPVDPRKPRPPILRYSFRRRPPLRPAPTPVSVTITVTATSSLSFLTSPNMTVTATSTAVATVRADPGAFLITQSIVRATASVLGETPPGVTGTPRAYLATGRHPAPCTFAETSDGILMIASGFDPMLRWDGLALNALSAGVKPPATALTLSGSGIGRIMGTYTAYVRFIDCYGNHSNFGPASAEFKPVGVTGSIKSIGDFPVASPIGVFPALTGVPNRNSGGAFTIAPQSVKGVQVETQAAHGLTTGAMVRIADETTSLLTIFQPSTTTAPLIIYGAPSDSVYDGVWEITVDDATHFTLNESVQGGEFRTGGTWSSGVNALTYASVPVPTDPKVVRRQILRNTDGQASVYYVDIDTTDLQSTTFTSSKLDTTEVVLVDANHSSPTYGQSVTYTGLDTGEAVPLLDETGKLFANRHLTPPDHKTVVVQHQGRMFANVDAEDSDGMVQVTFGSNQVQGIGTRWTAQYLNRFLYVQGGDQPYQIIGVDVVHQLLTITANNPLTTAANTINATTLTDRTSRLGFPPESQIPPILPSGYYGGPTDAFATYTIKPAPGERRLVYYSEADEQESWPALNSFSIANDGDDQTGAMSLQSHLHILEKRHIWRWTYQDDPALTGSGFPAADRGCLNQQCWVALDNTAYLLDEQGIHAFSGQGESAGISQPVQELFRVADTEFRINFARSSRFHAALYPGQQVIRWFVCMSGARHPRHALALHYPSKRFWIEEYARPIAASAVGNLGNARRVFLGGEGRHVHVLWEGTLDGADAASGSVQGTVTGSTLTTLSDAAGTFDATGIVGAPVVLTSGPGKRQCRIITAVSGATLSLDLPWLIQPTVGDAYQVGGILWNWISGQFAYAKDEEANPQNAEIIYQPLTTPATMDLRVRPDAGGALDGTGAIIWQTDVTFASGNGIATVAGTADLVIDLTKPNGIVEWRNLGNRELYTDGPRWVSFELRGVGSQESQRIFEVNLTGVSQ